LDYRDLVDSSLYGEYKWCDDIRKEGIVEEVFKIIRSVNKFPEKHLDFDDEIGALRTLSNMRVENIYKENKIGRSVVGNSLCYKFYPNIWDVVRIRARTRPISMRDSFYIDDDLKKEIRMNLTYDNDVGGLRSWFRLSDVGYCMNFRPTAAKVIYESNLGSDSKVLDYASGYGGRLLGAWGSNNVSEYVGIDPNTNTYENGLNFIKFLEGYPNIRSMKLYKECSEDFCINKFPNYRGYFDMAFSSPPYFTLEKYSDEDTQCYNKFPEYKEWVKGYLKPTINNCIDMLKEDGIFAVNIFDVSDKSKDNFVAPKIKDIIKIICYERGFKLFKEDRLLLGVKPGIGDRDRKVERSEPIWYFKRFIK
jgi:hypothetical protein